jgi:hypothetical protein
MYDFAIFISIFAYGLLLFFLGFYFGDKSKNK